MPKRTLASRLTATSPLLPMLAALLLLGPIQPGFGAAEDPPADTAGSSRSFIPSRTHTLDEDRAVLKLFDGLRVADVSDGMDAIGLQDVGVMDSKIAPLWRDLETFRHRFCGVAVTVRYVPTNKRIRPTLETFHAEEGRWYRELSPEPFVPLLRQGSVVVIDGHEDGDTGTIGSNNIMLWKTRGAVGVVTSGGARDTDEIIKEKVPLYFKGVGRGIRPGRNEVESVNRPVTVGRVLVRAGDVVIADGDGVVVVPREHAKTVARAAREMLEVDKAARRTLYEKLGLPPDTTVTPSKP
jgi:4-hydroxy-4-methyl-2-oxoglutarate aldolase